MVNASLTQFARMAQDRIGVGPKRDDGRPGGIILRLAGERFTLHAETATARSLTLREAHVSNTDINA